MNLDPDGFNQFTPRHKHAQRAFHGTQFGLLGGFFGLGMAVRGNNGFRTPKTWSIKGLDDDGYHIYGVFCSPLLTPTLSYATVCLQESDVVDFGARVQFVVELDLSRVKVLADTDKMYYLAREHWVSPVKLHVVVRGACPEYYSRGHIADQEESVVRVALPVLERSDEVFAFQATWRKRPIGSVPMIDNPAARTRSIVPSVSAGTLMYIQPVLQHPVGQNQIDSWRTACDAEFKPVMLGQTRLTFGVPAVFHRFEVAFLLKSTYEDFADEDVESAWAKMVPCTIHEVLQYCVWATGTNMQQVAEADRFEALRRWCHWFVCTYPIKNWATRKPVHAHEVPEVPAAFRVMLGGAASSSTRGMDVGDVPGACLPAVPIETAMQHMAFAAGMQHMAEVTRNHPSPAEVARTAQIASDPMHQALSVGVDPAAGAEMAKTMNEVLKKDPKTKHAADSPREPVPEDALAKARSTLAQMHGPANLPPGASSAKSSEEARPEKRWCRWDRKWWSYEETFAYERAEELKEKGYSRKEQQTVLEKMSESQRTELNKVVKTRTDKLWAEMAQAQVQMLKDIKQDQSADAVPKSKSAKKVAPRAEAVPKTVIDLRPVKGQGGDESRNKLVKSTPHSTIITRGGFAPP